MIIRRLSLTLPATMRASAATDARVLGEALALELAGRGAPATHLTLNLAHGGQSAPVLAARLAATLPAKGGRHGG
jgi:hypothetical protein